MPVESLERIEHLLERWYLFTARGDARLLIWELQERELALVEAFVARENEPEFARTRDLILRLETPFVDGAHATRLVAELCEQFNELGEVAPDDLLSALRALRAHCWPEGAHAKVVVWLHPSAVYDATAYRAWLAELVEHAPDELRFLVVDTDRSGLHAPLADGARVIRESCRPEVGDLFLRVRSRLVRCIREGDRLGAERACAEAMALVDPRHPSRAASFLLTLTGGFAIRGC